MKNGSPEEILGLGARKESSDHLPSARLTCDGNLGRISLEASEGFLKESESVDDIPYSQVLVCDTGRRKKSENAVKKKRENKRTSARVPSRLENTRLNSPKSLLNHIERGIRDYYMVPSCERGGRKRERQTCRTTTTTWLSSANADPSNPGALADPATKEPP